MKARLAGLVLLMGISAAAHAHPHHTFAGGGQPSPGLFSMLENRIFQPLHQFKKIEHQCNQECGGAGGGASPSPVPEPETYAMLLAGLGLIATIARRRQAGK